MAPRKCSLTSCEATGQRCYSLPTDDKIRALWLKWIAEVEGAVLNKKNILICERHFPDDVKGLKKLRKGAVPCLVNSINVSKPSDVNSTHDVFSVLDCDNVSKPADVNSTHNVLTVSDRDKDGDACNQNTSVDSVVMKHLNCYTELDDIPISSIVEVDVYSESEPSTLYGEMIDCGSCAGIDSVEYTSTVIIEVCDRACSNRNSELPCRDEDSNGVSSDVDKVVDGNAMACDETFCEGKNSGAFANDKMKTVVMSMPRIQRRCSVSGCDHNNTNSTMFAFPRVTKITNGKSVIDQSSLRRCEQWVQFCENNKIISKDILSLHKHFYVCHAHFADNDFSNLGKKQLRKHAVPTVLRPECSRESLSESSGVHESNSQGVPDSNHNDFLVGLNMNLEARFQEKLNDLRSARSRKFSKKFEDLLKTFAMQCCTICKEKFMLYPGLKKAHRGKNLCWKFSSLNKMDPGIVPEALSDLSFLEEQLIARVHPVLMVHKLKGCQYGYKGNVINFMQDVKEFAKQLPHRIEDLNSIITVRFKHHDGRTSDFRVRAQKIREALVWLKENNEYYHNIDISEENLEILPEDDNIFDMIPSLFLSENDDTCEDSEIGSTSDVEDAVKVTESGVPCANFVNQNEQLSVALDWPEQSSDPVSESTPGMIMCAFPTLFPYGNCDFRESREKEIKMHEYFRHFLCYSDDRFAKHRTFRFFAFNMWMRHTALRDGNVFVNKDHELSKMNVSQLKEHIKENPNVLKKLMFMGTNIRGSKSYWKSRCGELKDMVEQLGLPTVFLTMSAADMYWPDLFRLLTGKHVSEISMKERRKLIQDNPLVVDMFFQHRVECYIENVLQPKYEIVDYWYRIEYQHRGSPHLHGLFWFRGAPDVSKYKDDTIENKKKMVKYFDELVTAVDPCPECPVPDRDVCETLFEEVTNVELDLAQLLKKVQRHKHGEYCQRVDKKTKRKVCRFKFPFDVESTSRMEVNCETEELLYFPERNDTYLNKFNPFIISTWRANIDIAPVLSKQAVIEYLAKYVSKSEPGSTTLKDICASVCGSVNGADKAKRAIHKILMKNCVERDISAQEVCHILMGSKLFCAGGRNFVVVYTTASNWIPLSENNDGNEQVSSNNGKSFMQKYAERPEGLHQLCMWDIAKMYNTRNWKKVKKENIVRVFPRLSLKGVPDNDEEYYRQRVLLFVPWNKETECTLKGVSETWKDVYDRCGVAQLEVSKLDLKVPVNTENPYEDEDEEDGGNLGDIRNEDWMIASRLCQGQKANEIELGLREVDVDHDWSIYLEKYEKHGDLQYFQSFIENEKKKSPESIQVSEMPSVIFSKEQEDVKRMMEKQIEVLRGGDSSGVPKRVLVQGKAGTGKSLLIKYLVDKLHCEFGSGSYLLLGPTGVSAINIGGSTVHSVLRIPTKSSHFKPLTGEAARKFCDVFEKVKFVIIDEYSMIGCSMLGKIDKRLREGTGVNEPFGSLNIYFFGDYKQLPPVKDCPLYSVPKNELAQHGKNVFDSFEAHFLLSKGHRQNDVLFLELLDRLSVGEMNMSDYDTLKQRFDINVSRQEQSSFEDAIRLFSTKEAVEKYNREKLHSLRDDNGNLLPLARIPAKHHGRGACYEPADRASGLQSVLYLGRGTRIMLRSNLWVQQGLVNGAMGTVVDILYDRGKEPPNHAPSILMCKFDNYRGVGIGPENLIPIAPVLRSWSTQSGIQCSRQQFPVVVCYACSIHKSQGLTLEKAVIDIGPNEFALGLSYVALSRVKTLHGILLKPFSYQRLCTMKTKPEMLLRKQFENLFELSE